MSGNVTQRDLVMRFSAKYTGDLAKLYKEMAKSVKQATEEADHFNQVLKQHLSDYKSAMQSIGGIDNKTMNKALADEDKLQRKIRERMKLEESSAAQAARLGGRNAGGGDAARNAGGGGLGTFGSTLGQGVLDMAGIGGITKLGTAAGAAGVALTGLTMAIRGYESQLRLFYASLEFNASTGRAQSGVVQSRVTIFDSGRS